MHYYEVSPNVIIRSEASAFTYSSEQEFPIGSMVIVPVGKRELVGIVVKKVSRPEYQTKEIIGQIEARPIPEALVKTAKWMAEHYMTHQAVVWQTVLPRGLTKKRREKSQNNRLHKRSRTKNVFTRDQLVALAEIEKMSPGTALLHGVTGSGKTLVYIEAAKKSLADGRSVIILVPEIALTSQLVAEFSNHFDDVLLTHSRQTEAERHLVWREALNSDQPRVVIGPRSALFMPLANVGLIVIDECHEPSFKQEQSPRYSALRTASILAGYHQAKVILGSATPNVADYFLAKQSKRPIITMPTPARTDTVAPEVKLVDMTKRGNFNLHPFLSDKLIQTLEETFASNNQSLIFHNRRGTASTTLCENCGWQAGCPHCFVPLTLHADQHTLRCHICGLTSKVPTSCPECQTAEIIHKGLGTKRIEAELRKLFPKQNIARFDGDASKDETVEQNYDKLYSGEIDLIIGTQVIAKGLDLPHLRTVGIVQADAGLALPDFSSPERTFQLLAQVIGRVGRSHHPTTVIAQTYQPNHPSIQDGISQNYQDFYERTIRQRRHTNFPPFCHLLKLTCVYKTEKSAVTNARKLATELKSLAPDHVEILGPTPAFYERVRDTYRWQLVIKSPKRQDLIELLKHLPKTHWQFELDPTSLL